MLRLELEAAELKVKFAEREKHLEELARDQSQTELDSYRIVSPLDIMVVEVIKHEGEGLQFGEEILCAVSAGKLRVERLVNLEQSYKLERGMPVVEEFKLLGTNEEPKTQKVTGQLGFVDASVRSLSDRVRVWADVENPSNQIKEGAPVTMKVTLVKVPEEQSKAPE